MFTEKLNLLKQELIEYATLTEQMISSSVRGLAENDRDLLNRIITALEPKANTYEIGLDELCVTVIAQFEPKARDLRIVLMIMKMSNDFERMADHAVNIAESSLFLIERPAVKPLIDIPNLADMAIHMLRDSIASFIREDGGLALRVCERDAAVDNLRDQIIRELITYMVSDPSTIERCLHLMRIARDLERIADLSTNISEDVLYMVEGRVIKHHAAEQ